MQHDILLVSRASITLILIASINPLSALPPVQGNKAVFDISQAVVVAGPPRFGVNIDPPAMNHWNTEPWHNQWWNFPNPNPITARMKGTATGGSSTTLEDENKGRGISYYDVFRTGFFDGGTAIVYRFDHNKVCLVRQGKIACYEASVGGPNRIVFTDSGPEIKQGDLYVLTTTRTNFPQNITRTWKDSPWWLCSGLSLYDNHSAKTFYDAGVRVALDSDVPPHGGGGSFALTVPSIWSTNNPPVTVGDWLISGEHPDNPRFHEGKKYTLHLWLKQRGMPTGSVQVHLGKMASVNFQVTDQWREYTTDFLGTPPKKIWAERFEIQMAEPGTLLIDNITMIEKDGPPPYAFYPQIVEKLRQFRPSTLRLWVLQSNTGFGKDLDDVLGDPAESNLIFQECGGAQTATPVGLHRQLELCEEVGADPWIITSTLFTAQEQKNLIEYLAGPQDSPYGKKRAKWGHPLPWTDSFHQIKLEMGNETWNSMFQLQSFPISRGDLYGAYSEFMFQQMRSSPWYDRDKFQFVINGFVAEPGDESYAYGAAALRNAPSAQAVDLACYTGGWDAAGLTNYDNSKEGWMTVFSNCRHNLLPAALTFKKTADSIAVQQGRPGAVECLVYEAGPGYSLPSPGKFKLQEQQEGKSLGQAINTLDIFMNNLRNGYGVQCFFMFKNGHYWASHNRNWGEHIAWKALEMRNRYLEGDLITAISRETVSMDIPEPLSQSNNAHTLVKSFSTVNFPLVDCYPFRKGLRYSFMLISRRLDAPTKVTLNLPYTPESQYTQYTLTGNTPDLNNIESEMVRVVPEEKEGMTRSFSLEMPPHSVIVLVNDQK